MKSNIALIGFMGTGKTTAGRLLAERMGRRFIETDVTITECTGKSIPDIFRERGEIAFRELEIAVIKEIAGEQDCVIACGGGAVLNRINIDRLRQSGVVVLLAAAPAVILKRTLIDGEGRPLLNTPDRAASIRELMRFRKPFYERAADITVDTSRLDTREVVDSIIEKLAEYESTHPEK